MRLDLYLVENALASTRSKAQDLIKSQKVLVNGKKMLKPKYEIQENDEVKIIGEVYVSRSAEKLERFLKQIKVDFEDKVVLDVGSSTGGFTEFVLHQGAKKVYAVDVGTNQLDEVLRVNENVISMENSDVRDLKKSDFIEELDVVLIDISFISLKNVLPKVGELISKDKQIIALFKPQFEVGKEKRGAGGVVRDEALIDKTVAELIRFSREHKLKFLAQRKSKLKGKQGNQEAFILFEKR